MDVDVATRLPTRTGQRVSLGSCGALAAGSQIERPRPARRLYPVHTTGGRPAESKQVLPVLPSVLAAYEVCLC